MNLATFYEKIDSHPDLDGVGVDHACEHPSVVIRHNPTQLITRLPVAAIEACDWATLESVFAGRREPKALQHMTRVVGYFSRIENWNKSKLGELADRRKGAYAVTGEERA